MDSEGWPIQELSALAMDRNTHEVVDVFHGHAYTEEEDSFARRHIHGLNRDFLINKGFHHHSQLINSFKEWLRNKNYLIIYGNAPSSEMAALEIEVSDIYMDKWAERVKQPYHQVALRFKNLFIPICGKSCCKQAHSSFQYIIVRRPNNESDIARRQHGFHCSLYDVYELYLFYIFTN